MSIIKYDYHMHTPLCGHAEGTPEEYVQHAIKMGLTEIGFSDHAPFVKGPLPGVCMNEDQLPTYIDMIDDVRKKYKDQISIKIALEADYIPGYEENTLAIIQSFNYDYIIGSVHFIGDWAFDDPGDVASWSNQDINQVYRDYYSLVRQSAESGLFDIIGHCDLVKKFGHRPTEDMTEEIIKTAETFARTSMAIEINTAGLRKKVNEMYPAIDALRIYREHNIPLTFGSDAHQPHEVGQDFNQALDLAKKAGYTEHVIFNQGLMTDKIKL